MASPALTIDDEVNWSPSQLATEVEGEVVILSVERGSYYGLNDIGSVIWRKLREPTRIAALCDELGQEFRGEDETIRRDVLAMLETMLKDGLIQKA